MTLQHEDDARIAELRRGVLAAEADLKQAEWRANDAAGDLFAARQILALRQERLTAALDNAAAERRS